MVTASPLPATRKRRWRLRKRSNRYDFDDSDWREAIGMDVGFLFQNAITAWEPTSYIGDQAGEALGEHTELTQEEIEERVFDALGDVKLPKAHKFFSFAHQMSRGEAQTCHAGGRVDQIAAVCWSPTNRCRVSTSRLPRRFST